MRQSLSGFESWRFRWALACLLSACSVFAAAQVRLSITNAGKPIGTAAVTQKLLANGDKLVQLTIDMKSPGGKAVTVRSEARYDAKGQPLPQFLETIGANPPTRRQVTATFDAAGARVIVDDAGVRKVSDVPLVDTAPRGDISQFWFIRDRPKPGATVQYYRFDADALKWTLMGATYIGPKEITVGKSKFKGFEVRDGRSVTIVDAQGLPIRIEAGGAVFERIGPE